MEHISLEKVNYGDHYIEKAYCDKVKNLDGGIISMTNSYLRIQNSSNMLESSISFYEEDPFTISWLGQFLDGTQFRIVKPNSRFISLIGNTITIASMYHDGYAVHFNIV